MFRRVFLLGVGLCFALVPIASAWAQGSSSSGGYSSMGSGSNTGSTFGANSPGSATGTVGAGVGVDLGSTLGGDVSLGRPTNAFIKRQTINTSSFNTGFTGSDSRDLNTRIGVFPSNVIAGLFGFKTAEFFEVEDSGIRQPVKVGF